MIKFLKIITYSHGSGVVFKVNYSYQAKVFFILSIRLSKTLFESNLCIYSILTTFLGEHQHIRMDSIASYSDEELCGWCTDDGEVKSSLPKTFQAKVRYLFFLSKYLNSCIKINVSLLNFLYKEYLNLSIEIFHFWMNLFISLTLYCI